MNDFLSTPAAPPRQEPAQGRPRRGFHPAVPLKIAVLAMGGQGGGVLADWIVDMAEHAGWWAQTTSVPGVAQRTGATIYYLELLPESAVREAGRMPALAMMPTPGDVDIVLAAELMEGGRAMQRGLVTPDRTTLISSSHRSYAVAEKSAPGNGIADSGKVIEAGRLTAKCFYCLDLQEAAESAGSVISASLFGALAAAEVLPFAREDYENTIRRGGIGADASLRAFAAGWALVKQAPQQPASADAGVARPTLPDMPDQAASREGQALLDRARQAFPPAARPMLLAGLRRVLEFQDLDYGREYLDRMAAITELDRRFGGEARDWALTTAAARYVAVAMAYDDVIRVADLKTRGSRFDRVRDEVRAQPGQVVYATEYMHPRLEEVCGAMPAALGRAILASPTLGRLLGPLFARGRHVRTGTLRGFLMLYGLAGMRRFRRATLRHHQERASLEAWLAQIHDAVAVDYALAVEIVNCRRLVKGYSDTHARGDGKYQRLMRAAAALRGQADAAQQLRALRDAALADAAGRKLDDMLGRMPAPNEAVS